MTKCDMCHLSYIQGGKMECPYNKCMLTKLQIDELIEKMIKIGGTK